MKNTIKAIINTIKAIIKRRKINNLNFVHYGCTKFEIGRFDPISYSERNPWGMKPMGGFWASPEGERFCTWKHWCEKEAFHRRCEESNSYRFHLRKGSRVFVVDSKETFDNLVEICEIPDNPALWDPRPRMDYTKLEKLGYKAVLVLLSEYGELKHDLFGWDVDSLVVFDPSIIVAV